MESEDSFSSLQEPTNGPYPEQHESKTLASYDNGPYPVLVEFDTRTHTLFR